MTDPAPTIPCTIRGRALVDRFAALFEPGAPGTDGADGAPHRYQRILVPGMTGGENQWAILGVIAAALRARGATPTILMCDAVLPACTLRKVDHTESACTRWCHRHSGAFAHAFRLDHAWYGDLVPPDERRAHERAAARLAPADIERLSAHGVALGAMIERSIESWGKVSAVDWDDPRFLDAGRAFAAAALILVDVARRALERYAIDKVLLDDGGKTDWGIFRAVAAACGVPVDVLGIGIRGSSVRFELDRPGAPGQRLANWATWRDQPLSAAEDAALDAYLARRERVPFEYRAHLWHATEHDEAQLARDLGLTDRTGRILAMFPNVGFDSGRTRGAHAAYPTAREWVRDTVDVIARAPQHHLVIKSHPAEHHRAALDSALDSVTQRPPNLHVIPADSAVTAPAVARLADVVLTYTSTVTVEAAALGRPVLLAGGGWHAGRGVVTDVTTPDAYRAWLDRITRGADLPPARRELARRYAWCLFFRNDIPLTWLTHHDIHIAALHLSSADAVAPGATPALDAICAGVLDDAPYENPMPLAELTTA